MECMHMTNVNTRIQTIIFFRYFFSFFLRATSYLNKLLDNFLCGDSAVYSQECILKSLRMSINNSSFHMTFQRENWNLGRPQT